MSAFPPFTAHFHREKQNVMALSLGTSRLADIVYVEGIYRRTRKSKHEKETEHNIALLKEFLTLKGESKAVEEIAPNELK